MKNLITVKFKDNEITNLRNGSKCQIKIPINVFGKIKMIWVNCKYEKGMFKINSHLSAIPNNSVFVQKNFYSHQIDSQNFKLIE